MSNTRINRIGLLLIVGGWALIPVALATTGTVANIATWLCGVLCAMGVGMRIAMVLTEGE